MKIAIEFEWWRRGGGREQVPLEYWSQVPRVGDELDLEDESGNTTLSGLVHRVTWKAAGICRVVVKE